ncbi:MAG: hypothetical protein HQ402_01360 [Parcubacteria group bacterium]|nr:hypothetical protein [Parcubacteria group bacterium]
MSNDQFPRNEFALMSHAKYRGDEGKEEKVRLDPKSIKICRLNINRLVQEVGPGRFVLHTSPLKRAKLTMEIVADQLMACESGVVISKPLDWLRPDSNDLTQQNIDQIVDSDERAFHIFITHRRGIEVFLNMQGGVNSCAIFAQEFTIN